MGAELWVKKQTGTIRSLIPVKWWEIKRSPRLGRWSERNSLPETRFCEDLQSMKAGLRKLLHKFYLGLQSAGSMSSKFSDETKFQMMWRCLILQRCFKKNLKIWAKNHSSEINFINQKQDCKNCRSVNDINEGNAVIQKMELCNKIKLKFLKG